MALSKPKKIKLTDLAKAIDKAVEASAGKKFPGGTIVGRILPPNLVDKINVNAVARDVTKQVQAAFPDAKLVPKVIIDGGTTTMGFIIRPVDLDPSNAS